MLIDLIGLRCWVAFTYPPVLELQQHGTVFKFLFTYFELRGNSNMTENFLRDSDEGWSQFTWVSRRLLFSKKKQPFWINCKCFSCCANDESWNTTTNSHIFACSNDFLFCFGKFLQLCKTILLKTQQLTDLIYWENIVMLCNGSSSAIFGTFEKCR